MKALTIYRFIGNSVHFQLECVCVVFAMLKEVSAADCKNKFSWLCPRPMVSTNFIQTCRKYVFIRPLAFVFAKCFPHCEVFSTRLAFIFYNVADINKPFTLQEMRLGGHKLIV